MVVLLIGLLLSSFSKHNMLSYYDWVVVVIVVNTICGRIMIVNTICGRIMIGLSLSSVSKHNMWSYYDWRIIIGTGLSSSVNTICGRIMIVVVVVLQ